MPTPAAPVSIVLALGAICGEGWVRRVEGLGEDGWFGAGFEVSIR